MLRMKVAYVRVSTIEQNEERQIESLSKYDIERWYTEKISGKNTNSSMIRPPQSVMVTQDIQYPFFTRSIFRAP